MDSDLVVPIYDDDLVIERLLLKDSGMEPIIKDDDQFLLDRLKWLSNQEGFVQFNEDESLKEVLNTIFYAEFKTAEQSHNAGVAKSMIFVPIMAKNNQDLFVPRNRSVASATSPALKPEIIEWINSQPFQPNAWINSGGQGAREDYYPRRKFTDISHIWLDYYSRFLLGFQNESDAILFKMTWL